MLNTNRQGDSGFGDYCGLTNTEGYFQGSGLTYRRPRGKTINFRDHIRKKNSYQDRLAGDFQAYLESDELDICYQPLVDLEKGTTTGVEALLRWQHKLAGPISPDIFIPVAEQTGAIHALTFRVLDHALRQLHAWETDGICIDVAVNLSMFNLHYENFPLQVARLLKKWSIAPDRLILEVTEGVIMYDPEQATRILEKLDNLGTRLALDDFGTGYSSLSHLARLPIRELKIDRSLIRDIDKNSKNAVIVCSTIELAQKLGLKIVAEGVEDIVVLNILKEYGCATAQGYFFSKPVNQVDFKAWYLNRHGKKYNPPLLPMPQV
ncbi:MAG: putative bifunctional diguanylate cyclase/phosphodiesterase [Gammaproteobacteria bacterium]